jgi:hypothetical protein
VAGERVSQIVNAQWRLARSVEPRFLGCTPEAAPLNVSERESRTDGRLAVVSDMLKQKEPAE